MALMGKNNEFMNCKWSSHENGGRITKLVLLIITLYNGRITPYWLRRGIQISLAKIKLQIIKYRASDFVPSLCVIYKSDS